MGLVLAIPLTVCLVVLGHYIPRLAFLSALMSDEQPLPLYQQCYYRLISGDFNEAFILIDNYLKNHSIVTLYDQVMIPIIWEVEYEFHNESLDFDQKEFLYQNIGDVIEELESRSEDSNLKQSELTMNVVNKVLCIPLRFERDELTARMLIQLLNKASINAQLISLKQMTDNFEKMLNSSYSTVIISAAPMYSLLHVRHLSAQLKKRRPELKIIGGLWGHGEVSQEIRNQLKLAGIEHIVLSFEEALSFFESENVK
jgi:hypothetical protein